MSERDRGEKPKKSWREIDAGRDRAGGAAPRSGGPPSRSAAEEARNSKQYRAALDAMFEKGEIGKMAEKLQQTRQPPALQDMPKKAEPPPEPVKPVEKPEDPKATLRKKVLAALGRDEISRVVDKYVKAYGWPQDFEILEQALEHHKDDRVREAMDALAQLLEREKPKRNRTLIGKLRFIEETNGDPELKDIAAKLRARL